MNGKAIQFVKNVFFAVSANLSRIVTTFVLTMVLPKLLTVDNYSYWQLYGFYGAYLTYSSLGLCEGTFLKYAGKKYEELDCGMQAAQLRILGLWEAVFGIAVLAAGYILLGSGLKFWTLFIAVLFNWIQILRYQLQTILQMCYRIKEYARVYSGERVLHCLLVIGCIACGLRDFRVIAMMEVTSNILMTVYALYLCREVAFAGFVPLSSAVNETRELVVMGIKLTLAGLANQLIIGIVRFSIENKWGVTTFGEISLSLSMANMLTTCINAVSIVMFPALKNFEASKLDGLYHPIRVCLTVPMYGALLLYVPMKVVLSLWLPQYAESLRYLAILFPMCIYEIRNTVLNWTYLKIYRRESDILRIGVIMVVVCAGTTAVFVYALDSLELAVVSIALLYAIRTTYTEFVLNRSMKAFEPGACIVESVMSIVFIAFSWYFSSVWAMAGYAAAYAVYFLLNREDMMRALKQVRKTMGRGPEQKDGGELCESEEIC